jgi:hypothetical protein
MREGFQKPKYYTCMQLYIIGLVDICGSYTGNSWISVGYKGAGHGWDQKFRKNKKPLQKGGF